MNIDVTAILSGIAIGVGATLVMDAWNLFLNRAFSIQSLNSVCSGAGSPHAERHLQAAEHSAAEQKPFECAVGWLAHYSIGVTLAVCSSAGIRLSGSRDRHCCPCWPTAS